jgi:hypothetical protein
MTAKERDILSKLKGISEETIITEPVVEPPEATKQPQSTNNTNSGKLDQLD